VGQILTNAHIAISVYRLCPVTAVGRSL
jgi:hypothetical protein